MAESKKLQVALYWGAACGGCDVAVLDTNEFILDVAAVADIRLWPIAVDGKYKDVEAMRDGELDLAIFNGAIRNSENEHIAKLLRQKSRILVAFGSCACYGGIPSLEKVKLGVIDGYSYSAGMKEYVQGKKNRDRVLRPALVNVANNEELASVGG